MQRLYLVGNFRCWMAKHPFGSRQIELSAKTCLYVCMSVCMFVCVPLWIKWGHSVWKYILFWDSFVSINLTKTWVASFSLNVDIKKWNFLSIFAIIWEFSFHFNYISPDQLIIIISLSTTNFLLSMYNNNNNKSATNLVKQVTSKKYLIQIVSALHFLTLWILGKQVHYLFLYDNPVMLVPLISRNVSGKQTQKLSNLKLF